LKEGEMAETSRGEREWRGRGKEDRKHERL
jgi:hypothetical protein